VPQEWVRSHRGCYIWFCGAGLLTGEASVAAQHSAQCGSKQRHATRASPSFEGTCELDGRPSGRATDNKNSRCFAQVLKSVGIPVAKFV
jgi:hypothetical protein